MAAGGLFALAVPTEAKARRIRFPRRGLRGGGRKTYGADTLTQEQLKTCLRYEGAADSAEVEVLRSEMALSSEKDALEREFSRLDHAGRTLDRYSQATVDSYNRGVQMFEVRQEQFNSRVDAHKRLVAEANEKASRFNSQCSNRKYYEDDMSAARRALGL